MTDTEWAQVLAGESAAIERFVDIYGRLFKLWVHRWVAMLPLGRRPDESGMVHDLVLAFLADERRLLRLWDRERGPREAYLYAVGRNRFVDELRCQQHEVLLGETVDDMDEKRRLESTSPGPREVSELETAVFRKQALAFVERQCTPEEWRLLCDLEVEERPAAVLAEELGLSIEALYQRKHRLLRRLHKLLEEYLAGQGRGSR